MVDFSFLIDFLLILVIALLIDSIIGEVPDRIHPTVWMGKIISFLKPRLRDQNPFDEKINGVLLAVFVMLAFSVPAYLIIAFTREFFGWIPYIIVSAVLLKMTFALKCMSQYTVPIAHDLEKGDIDGAKRLLPYIVRRDPSQLDERLIVSAAVESIAESSSDGVTSPLFFFVLFGIPGAFAFRVVSTLDSMVGYKDSANVNIGWFSANLDTMLNYIPTRLTAMMMILAGFLLVENWRGAYRIIKRDRHNMSSVNAGWTIAAMSGILSVQLEKPGFYKLGDGSTLQPNDILRALRVMNLTAVLFCFCVVVPILLLMAFLNAVLFSLNQLFW